MLTFEDRVLCGNPLQQFGSGLVPDPEPTWEFRPVANTSNMRSPNSWDPKTAGMEIILTLR